MNVVVIMRDILSRYTSRDGMNIAGALEFLDTVQAASAQPGLIGGIGHRIMSSIQTLMARYAQATTVTERVV